MEIRVRPEHEEFAARLGQAGVQSDAAKADSILNEIADAGLECAMAVLCVQTRSLVWTLSFLRGPDDALKLFSNTIAAASLAVDDDD